MNLTIHFGWWVLPLAVTIFSTCVALWLERKDGKAYGYAAAGAGVLSLIMWLVVIIVSLVAWLAWALLR